MCLHKRLLFVMLIFLLSRMLHSAETGYQQRVADLLNWADTTNSSNFLIAAARLRQGDTSAGVRMFEHELQRNDNSHRGMFVIYEMMTAYMAARKYMPEWLRTKVKNYLAYANFYRGDTENHLTMYYTGLYLAAQAFPKLPANRWYTGKTAVENKQEAENWLNEWMYLTTTIGQGEFDSPTYMTVFLAPMASLAQWATDPLLRGRARVMLHWLIADYAVEHLNGVYIGAHSREYPDRIIRPKHELSDMTAWGWLLFGKTKPRFHPTLLAIGMSDFELPDVLYGIGTDRSQPYVHTETKRVRNIIRLADRRNPPVYKYSYMTRDFGLGSMMGGAVLQPIQQHNWDVSFMTDSPYMTIFTLHPWVGEQDLGMFFPEEMKFAIWEVANNHTYYGKEDKWVSSSPYEQTFQHRNAIIVLYNIPHGERFEHIDGFFPKDLDRRDIDDSGWIFCQAHRTYIAYFPLKPYEWIEETNCYRLRSHELKNGCVLEVAQADDYASFEAFKKQINGNRLVHDTFDKTMTVSYTTSAGDVMTFTYNGARRLNGKLVDFADYKLFHGPFLNAEVGSQKLEICYKQKGMVLDMSDESRGQILPIYVCKRIETDFEINGKLDHPLWQQAVAVELMDAISGKTGRYRTRVRLLYSSRYLYVGFECDDDYVWGTIQERNGPIWEEECVEVFLNPANVPHQYYEINLSPKNTLFDADVLNGRTAEQPDNPFQSFPDLDLKDIKTATHINGIPDSPGQASGWTAAFAIPLTELWGAPNIPPQSGDVWRVNFYRIDSSSKGNYEYYAWSTPGIAAFHRPWQFGYLKFE